MMTMAGNFRYKIKNFTVNLVIIITTCFVLFFIFELGVRIFAPQSDPLFRWDDKIGIIHIPNKTGYFYRDEFKTKIKINSFGFIDKRWSIKKPADTYRIAILGDSVTEGMQVEAKDRFSDLLNGKLNQNSGAINKKIEVMNFGISSLGTSQEFLVYQDYVKQFKPDLVIDVFYSGNDVRNNSYNLETSRRDVANYGLIPFIGYNGNGTYSVTPSVYIEPVGIKKFLRDHSQALRFLVSRDYIRKILVSIKLLHNKIDKAGGRANLTNDIPTDYYVFSKDYDQKWQDALKTTEESFSFFDKEVKKNGAKFIVILLPSREQVSPGIFQKVLDAYPAMKNLALDINRPNSIIVPFLNGQKISYLDLLEEFKNISKNEELYYQRDGHLTQNGHSEVADILYNYLISNNVIN